MTRTKKTTPKRHDVLPKDSSQRMTRKTRKTRKHVESDAGVERRESKTSKILRWTRMTWNCSQRTPVSLVAKTPAASSVFRRGSASPPPDDEAAARKKTLDQIFEDDDDDDEDDIRSARRANYDDDDEDLPSVGQAIRAGVARKQREAVGAYEDDLDDFIEEDEDDEEMQGLDEDEREARRQERREEKRRARMSGSAANPAKAGIDAEAWDEVHEIFGNGEDYAWALQDEDEDILDEDKKAKMEYKDIFEPAQIAERMLTEEDERIKRIDIPERLQLACPGEEGLKLLERKLTDAELFEAAKWASTRISTRTSAEFLDEAGLFHAQRSDFINAVQLMLSICSTNFSRCLSSSSTGSTSSRSTSLTRPSNVPVRSIFSPAESSTLSADSASSSRRCSSARTSCVPPSTSCTSMSNPRTPMTRTTSTPLTLPPSKGVPSKPCWRKPPVWEEISDITEYLTLRYGQKMRDVQTLSNNGFDQAAEDMEGMTLNGEPVLSATPGFKKPSLVGSYERTKNTVISELAKKFGITSDELAANITSHTRQYSPRDPEESPFKFAEQFMGSAWARIRQRLRSPRPRCCSATRSARTLSSKKRSVNCSRTPLKSTSSLRNAA